MAAAATAAGLVRRPALCRPKPILGRLPLATVEPSLVGFERGDRLALSLAADAAGLAWPGGSCALTCDDPVAQIAAIEAELRPRWVWWSADTALQLARAGVRVATCWDLVAVHRLLFGGWRAEPALIWAALHDLPAESLPGVGQLDLLGQDGEEGTDPENPVRPDGHLRPEWSVTGWRRDPARLVRWAATALAAAGADVVITELPHLIERAEAVARSISRQTDRRAFVQEL
ncbi:MAG: hypothetical protein M3Y42_16690, partial [Actinomycetota bacterium]|nr:hypothetical protein [Actinomycetota bacterium]